MLSNAEELFDAEEWREKLGGWAARMEGHGAKMVLGKRKWIVNLFPIKKNESGSRNAPEGTFGGRGDHERPTLRIHRSNFPAKALPVWPARWEASQLT